MIDVEVCLGSACFVKGSHQIVAIVREMIEENGWTKDVNVKGAFCMDKCNEKGIGVKVDGEPVSEVGIYNVREKLEGKLRELVEVNG